MKKEIREALSEEQLKQRIEIIVVMLMNISLVEYKRGKALDAIMKAKQATEFNPQESKAFFRLAMAHKLANDFDSAKASFINAIKLDPNNLTIRREYIDLVTIQSEKEKQW